MSSPSHSGLRIYNILISKCKMIGFCHPLTWSLGQYYQQPVDSTTGYSGQVLHEWCHIQEKCCGQHCVDNYDKFVVKLIICVFKVSQSILEIRHWLWHSLSVEEEDMQCWSSDYPLVVSIVCRWADKHWTQYCRVEDLFGHSLRVHWIKPNCT